MSDSLLRALEARTADAAGVEWTGTCTCTSLNSRVDWTGASLDEITAILFNVPDLDSFLSAAAVCHTWRTAALPLLHSHGQDGIWYNLCCRFDPTIVWLRDVRSYWRLHLKLLVASNGSKLMPALQMEDLQFLLRFGRSNGVHPNAYTSPAIHFVCSIRLDGADAANVGFAENAGSWFWNTPGLCDQLGWKSIDEAQTAAERYEDALIARRATSGSDCHRTLVEMRIFHAPTQRMLQLSGEWLAARRLEEERRATASALSFYPMPLPQIDLPVDAPATMMSVAIYKGGGQAYKKEYRMRVDVLHQPHNQFHPRPLPREEALFTLQQALAWSGH